MRSKTFRLGPIQNLGGRWSKIPFYNCSYKHVNPPSHMDIQELRNQIKNLERNIIIKAIICTDENFEMSKCNKRHPKECRFYNQFQRCKFYNCSYKHVNPPSHMDIQELRNQIKNLERNIIIKASSDTYQCEMCDYNSQNDRKVKTTHKETSY